MRGKNDRLFPLLTSPEEHGGGTVMFIDSRQKISGMTRRKQRRAPPLCLSPNKCGDDMGIDCFVAALLAMTKNVKFYVVYSPAARATGQ
jgi:hypothetical protein